MNKLANLIWTCSSLMSFFEGEKIPLFRQLIWFVRVPRSISNEFSTCRTHLRSVKFDSDNCQRCKSGLRWGAIIYLRFYPRLVILFGRPPRYLPVPSSEWRPGGYYHQLHKLCNLGGGLVVAACKASRLQLDSKFKRDHLV
jgi:hypothetical protein